MKRRDRKYETSGQCYLMQSGEAVFIAEVWTHIILQQVAHWWKNQMRKHLNFHFKYEILSCLFLLKQISMPYTLWVSSAQ